MVFCGIGTPENLFHLLKQNNIRVKKKIIYPDHYNYKQSDINEIVETALNNNLKILTTEKDYMKISKFKNMKVKYTDVDLHISNNISFKKFIINNL